MDFSALIIEWISFPDIPEKPAQLSAFKRLLNMLGPESRNILEKLIKLLVKVELNRQSTLMNSKNLAIVFSPTLLRAPATVVDVIQLLGEQVKGSVVIEALIQEYKFFFVVFFISFSCFVDGFFFVKFLIDVPFNFDLI